MSWHELTRRLRSARRGPLFDANELTETEHRRDAIHRVLPHRGSMLLLDAITAVDSAGRIIARRTIAQDDPVFDGHFPDDPVYPGALQIEAIGQAGLCMRHFSQHQTTSIAADATPGPVRLVKVIEAHFLEAVRPGDQVELRCEVVEDNGYTFVTMGQMLRDGKPVSVGAFEAMILDEDEAF